MKKLQRFCLEIQGQVQGVGFRPFIWNLASKLNLSGFCLNSSQGVTIEIQGEEKNIDQFMEDLYTKAPPLAKMENVKKYMLPIVATETNFEIRKSQKNNDKGILVAPDVSTCPDCFKEVESKGDRRHDYAFANCVNCGPRYSITASLPYDRANTTMHCFAMCDECRKEYENPSNRRFHAQPIACEKCGPKIWFVDKTSEYTGYTENNAKNAIARAASFIINNKIIAMKGLGGFQLVCNARSDLVIKNLRIAKNRPHKALALMTKNCRNIQDFCSLEDDLVSLLESAAKPITLCPKSSSPILPVSSLVAPDNLDIGVMLPYTPLHFLLLKELENQGVEKPVLVMTSANARDEPICLGNREALQKLKVMSDGFLLHDRDILIRVDDSVAGVDQHLTVDSKMISHPVYLRRARGYVPSPLSTPFSSNAEVLGCGGELKSTFSLSRHNHIFTSQHIGDLKSPATLDFYASVFRHLQILLDVNPALIIHDMHPDFISTRFARDFAEKNNLPLLSLQHHAAHAASVLGENGITDPALVICLDGSGLGTDDSIWGGEFIEMELGKGVWKRAGSFEKMLLPGGEKAISEPWRVAWALMPEFTNLPAEIGRQERQLMNKLIEKKINSPETSSCGRLFDAMSSLLGICHKITYEGQAAIKLETEARRYEGSEFGDVPFPLHNMRHDLPVLETITFLKKIYSNYLSHKNQKKAAMQFHLGLAKGVADFAKYLCSKRGLKYVGFSGGVMQNCLLRELTRKEFQDSGLIMLFHKNLPFGDANISHGQAVWGQALLASGKIAL